MKNKEMLKNLRLRKKAFEVELEVLKSPFVQGSKDLKIANYYLKVTNFPENLEEEKKKEDSFSLASVSKMFVLINFFVSFVFS